MGPKSTRQEARSARLGAAVRLRPAPTELQRFPEQSPRDVPEPLGDLPPEKVRGSRDAGSNPKKKKATGPEQAQPRRQAQGSGQTTGGWRKRIAAEGLEFTR